jgi:hypothetical protein
MSGGVQPLVAFLERMMAVGQREGIGAQATVMVPIVGGSGSNQTATVVIRFDSANTWADGVAKQNASSAWLCFCNFSSTELLINQSGHVDCGCDSLISNRDEILLISFSYDSGNGL